MKKIRIIDVIVGFNILELFGIFFTLFMAFALQLYLNELPCPLCLLQRIGLMGVAFGFLMNLRFGLRPSHYSIVLLSALFTSFVALRQIALHVVPNTGSYGSPLFGLHLYTWSFIISMIIILATTLLLGIDRQYKIASVYNIHYPRITHILFGIMAILIIMNIISVYQECGFQECPDNPIASKRIK